MFLGGCSMIKKMKINKEKNKDKIKLFDLIGEISIARDTSFNSNISSRKLRYGR